MSDVIIHRSHKYESKYWKNGRWHYIYGLQDLYRREGYKRTNHGDRLNQQYSRDTDKIFSSTKKITFNGDQKVTLRDRGTSNEIRQIIGMKPSNDPKADQLINSNLNQPENAMNQPVDSEELEKNPENYDQPEEQQENTSQDKNNVSIMDIPISQLPNFV